MIRKYLLWLNSELKNLTKDCLKLFAAKINNNDQDIINSLYNNSRTIRTYSNQLNYIDCDFIPYCLKTSLKFDCDICSKCKHKKYCDINEFTKKHGKIIDVIGIENINNKIQELCKDYERDKKMNDDVIRQNTIINYCKFISNCLIEFNPTIKYFTISDEINLKMILNNDLKLCELLYNTIKYNAEDSIDNDDNEFDLDVPCLVNYLINVSKNTSTQSDIDAYCSGTCFYGKVHKPCLSENSTYLKLTDNQKYLLKDIIGSSKIVEYINKHFTLSE